MMYRPMCPRDAGRRRNPEGPEVRVLLPPANSPSQQGPAHTVGQSRGCGAGPLPLRDVRRDEAAVTRRGLALFLCRLLMQSHFGKAQAGRNDAPAALGPRALRHISWLCGSTCEQSALLGPVQGQIEFGQTRRGQLDGLPAGEGEGVADRFDRSPKNSGPDHAVPVIFRAIADSER